MAEKLLLSLKGGIRNLMDHNKGFFSWLKNTFFEPKETQTDKKLSKFHYTLLILTAGILLMLLSNLFFRENQSSPSLQVINQSQEDQPVFRQSKTEKNISITDYENRYENQLKEALEQIVGLDHVSVVVNVDATEAKVYEKNITSQSQTTDETDRDGGKRNVEDMSKDEQVVIVRNGDQETPIIVKTKKPEIRGVLVVAKGAENIHLKNMIVEAVTKVLDVPSHRVAVLPKKTKEES
jgi:stage III sporulation protein AG